MSSVAYCCLWIPGQSTNKSRKLEVPFKAVCFAIVVRSARNIKPVASRETPGIGILLHSLGCCLSCSWARNAKLAWGTYAMVGPLQHLTLFKPGNNVFSTSSILSFDSSNVPITWRSCPRGTSDKRRCGAFTPTAAHTKAPAARYRMTPRLNDRLDDALTFEMGLPWSLCCIRLSRERSTVLGPKTRKYNIRVRADATAFQVLKCLTR